MLLAVVAPAAGDVPDTGDALPGAAGELPGAPPAPPAAADVLPAADVSLANIDLSEPCFGKASSTSGSAIVRSMSDVPLNTVTNGSARSISAGGKPAISASSPALANGAW